MAAAPAQPDDGFLLHLIEAVGGAIFGAVITIVTFRTRLSKMDGRMTSIEAAIATDKAEEAAYRRMSERRQLYMLEVLSDIANKVGANERLSDLTIRLLHTESRREDE